jgi:6-pyruvoyl-tetrahydropterin synthase
MTRVSIYEVSVEGGFTARHAIPAADGRLENPHEHDWRVTAVFRGDRLDPGTGVLIDFVAARKALEALEAELEGADLNAHAAFRAAPPSAERVAEFLARQLTERLGGAARLYRLEVTEAPLCRAAFLPHVDEAPGRS